MHDFAFILAGFGVGLIVGLTGVGGGSLMTPALIFFFGVKPHLAIGTDLLFAAFTKMGGTVSLARQRLVPWRVGLLCAGSIPAALLGLWTGAGAVLQERFSAPRALDTLRAGGAPLLVAVPSQLVLMLQWAERRQLAPIEGVELVLISGARWLRERTPALRRLFPRARIVEFYGASEASYVAWMDAEPGAPAQAVGRPFSNVDLHIGPDPRSAAP